MNLLFFTALVLLTVSFPQHLFAYNDTKTHPHLTESAVRHSTLDVYLQNDLGLAKSTVIKRPGTFLKEKYVTELIREGSHLEDVPMCRASNHFHNPVIVGNWKEGRMTDPFFPVNFYCWGFWLGQYPEDEISSNITWATGFLSVEPQVQTDDDTREFNPWDWGSAREYFYTYLTGKDKQGAVIAPDEESRNENLKKSFRAVGQVLHLLQDMAVPAHVRNDFSQGHTMVKPSLVDLGWIGNGYEIYVKRNNRSYFFDSIIKGNPAKNRLTDFWDTNLLDNNFSGADPGMDALGLSEYTNLNFLSEYTMFTDDFPFPKVEHVTIKLDAPPKIITDYDRKYVATTASHPGEQINHLAIVSFLKHFREVYFPDIKEKLPLFYDKKCYEDYAAHLIPRAIGYSSDLLDYFFRGRIDIQDFAVTFGSDSSVAGLNFSIKNTTPPSDATQTLEPEPFISGTIELSYDYTVNTSEGPVHEYKQLPDSIWTISPTEGQGINIAYIPITVIFPESVPADATDFSVTLAFKGKLGNEDGAVVGRVYQVDNNSRIAYSNRQDDGSGFTSNIYTVSPTGTLENPYRADVTDSTGTGMGTEENPLHFSPAWSGDGTKMAFETMFCSDYNTDLSCSSQNVVRNISVIDPYSEQPFPNNRVRADLTYENAWVSNSSFSPDGTRIAALMQKNNVMSTWLWGGLVVFNLEDGSSTLVNDYDNLLYTSLWGASPVWSPDGEQILYSVYQQYDAVTHDLEREGDLLLVNLTTKAITELTNDIYFDTQPSWSPDGEWIVFSSNRAGKGFMDIFLIDKNGDNPPSLLLDCAQYEFDCFNPVFSPSGLQVAFSNGSYIHTISSDGDLSSLKPIVGPGIIGGLDWSPVIPPPSITAQASPYVIIDEGDSTTLTWESSGAVKVLISGISDEQPADGSLVVSPQETTNYTLTAVGAAGVKTTTVRVTVW